MDDIYGNLSDEDLLALGRKAGYLPDDQGDQPEILANYDSPEAIQNRQDYRTWVPEQLGYTPASTQSAGTTQAPPAGSVVGYNGSGAPVKPGESRSVSGSTKVFDPGVYGQIEATRPGLEGDLARADQQAQAQDQGMLDAEVRARGYITNPEEVAAGKAPKYSQGSDLAAAQANTQANVDSIAQEGKDASFMQHLHDEFALEEQKYNAEAQAQSNQYKSDYLAALTDFRASRVDPSQLWHNMTGGERFGTMMSAFVHDFLGVKGINSSAMDTLNKAIDRNIDAQVQAIKTKGEAAEGFKSLWYMQRNQSQSDAEARARVRGFLLDGAKQAIIANMAPYKAALASAQGQSAIAQINDAFAKNLVDIYKHIDSNAAARRGEAIEKWRVQVQAAVTNRATAVQERQQAFQEKQSQAAGFETINDPETGTPVALYKPWIQKEERAKTREILEDAKIVGDDIKELRRIARALGNGGIDPITGTRLAGTAQQEFDSLSVRLAHHMVKALGERATDQDVEQMIKGLRTPSYLNQANADQVIAFTEDRILNPARVRVSSQGYIPGGDGIIRDAPDNIVFRGETADARNTHTPPTPTQDETMFEQAKGRDIKEPLDADALTGDLRSAHEAMLKQNPDLFTHPDHSGSKLDEGYGNPVPNDPAPWEKQIVDMMHIAQSPEEGTRKKAREWLGQVASAYLNGTNKDAEGAMAAWALGQLEEQDKSSDLYFNPATGGNR